MTRAYTGQPDRPYLLAPALVRDLGPAVKQEFPRSSERGRRTLAVNAVAAALTGQQEPER